MLSSGQRGYRHGLCRSWLCFDQSVVEGAYLCAEHELAFQAMFGFSSATVEQFKDPDVTWAWPPRGNGL